MPWPAGTSFEIPASVRELAGPALGAWRRNIAGAVLDRASGGWRGVEMTPKVVRQLQELRRELLGSPDRPRVDASDDDATTTSANAATAAA